MTDQTGILSAPSELAAVFKFFLFAVLAGCGGAVKFISASLRTNTTMSPRRFLFLLGANVFISGFSGLMGALIFSTISPDRNWQLIAAGVFGYLGTTGLDVISLALSKRMLGDPLPVSAIIPLPASVDPASPQVAPEPAKA
jgi:LydA holin phage, holin superfamily III